MAKKSRRKGKKKDAGKQLPFHQRPKAPSPAYQAAMKRVQRFQATIGRLLRSTPDTDAAQQMETQLCQLLFPGRYVRVDSVSGAMTPYLVYGLAIERPPNKHTVESLKVRCEAESTQYPAETLVKLMDFIAVVSLPSYQGPAFRYVGKLEESPAFQEK